MNDTALATAHARHADQRQTMIDSQLRPSDVIEPRLLSAIRSIARERFVPDHAVAMAYGDRAVPLGHGRAMNPTLTTARLIADLGLAGGEHVLLIGAANGYTASVLANMGVRVTAVESAPDLAAQAQAIAGETSNVAVVEAPLAQGAPDHGPFDALLIDGAVEVVPAGMLSQLTDGARLVFGLRDGPVTRLARAIKIDGMDAIAPVPFADLECVDLPGFEKPQGFTF